MSTYGISTAHHPLAIVADGRTTPILSMSDCQAMVELDGSHVDPPILRLFLSIALKDDSFPITFDLCWSF